MRFSLDKFHCISLYILGLFRLRRKNITYLLCIEHQNFKIIHIEKGALLIPILVQQKTTELSGITKLLSTVRDYNHTLTKSSQVVAATKYKY